MLQETAHALLLCVSLKQTHIQTKTFATKAVMKTNVTKSPTTLIQPALHKALGVKTLRMSMNGSSKKSYAK